MESIPPLPTVTLVQQPARCPHVHQVVYGSDILGTYASLARALDAADVPEGARIVDAEGRVRARLERRFSEGKQGRCWKVTL